MDDFTGDLTPFFEPIHNKPLIQNAIVLIRERKFRTDRWIGKDRHCYVFVDIHPEGTPEKSFAAKASIVAEAIKDNRIKIIKNGTEQYFD